MTTTDITKQHNSTAHWPPSFQHQPNYYNPTRGWQALKRWLLALSSPVRCRCFVLFLHAKQGAPKQKGVVIFSRLGKSTRRSSTICPHTNKSSSGGAKHPSLIPSGLIFPRIFCRKRPLTSSFGRSAICGSLLEFSTGLILENSHVETRLSQSCIYATLHCQLCRFATRCTEILYFQIAAAKLIKDMIKNRYVKEKLRNGTRYTT